MQAWQRRHRVRLRLAPPAPPPSALLPDIPEQVSWRQEDETLGWWDPSERRVKPQTWLRFAPVRFYPQPHRRRNPTQRFLNKLCEWKPANVHTPSAPQGQKFVLCSRPPGKLGHLSCYR